LFLNNLCQILLMKIELENKKPRRERNNSPLGERGTLVKKLMEEDHQSTQFKCI